MQLEVQVEARTVVLAEKVETHVLPERVHAREVVRADRVSSHRSFAACQLPVRQNA